MKRVVALVVMGLVGRSFGQSVEMEIPQISSQSPKVVVCYKVTKKTKRSLSDVTQVVRAKTKQYDEMVKSGQVSEAEAKRVLDSIRSGPTRGEESTIVSFVFERGTLLATASSQSKTSWTLISNGVSIESGWAGGDHITLSMSSEPYSSAVTQLPILPVQLPGIKEFVDLEWTKDGISARMIPVSTTAGDYLECKLSFKEGRLATAEVKGIERWTFSDYNELTDYFPKRILMERQFDQEGNPQITMECIKTNVADAKMQTLDRLLGSKSSVDVIDVRTDPPKQFIYVKGKGSILEQAKSGLPSLRNSKRTTNKAVGAPLSFGGVLVGTGLTLLFGLSIWKLVVARKMHNSR